MTDYTLVHEDGRREALVRVPIPGDPRHEFYTMTSAQEQELFHRTIGRSLSRDGNPDSVLHLARAERIAAAIRQRGGVTIER